MSGSFGDKLFFVATPSLLRLDSVPLSRWADFHAGRVSEKEIQVDPVVSRWNRVARTGLPSEGAAHPDGIGKSELEDRSAKLDDLFGGEGNLAKLLIPDLASRRMVMVLADEEGVILRARASGYDRRAVEARLVPGAAWHETSRGTNAIGTAIVERRSVAVIGRAHYERANHALFCYATPIIDPYGDVVGVFDVTGDVGEDDPRIVPAVRWVGASLESTLRASAYAAAVAGGARIVERMLDRCSGPAMLLEAPGIVRRANERAANLFGIDATGGVSVERLFGVGWNDLVRETISSGTASGTAPVFETRGSRYSLSLDPIVGSGGRILSVVVYADALTTKISRPPSSPPARSSSMPPSPVTSAVDPAFATLAGDDAKVAAAKRLASKLAPTSVPILLLAETGTGKDVLARAIHRASRRAKGPFVALNCGAFSAQLLESELFGFASGSFTGARVGGSEGKIAGAEGGTLFLDEIGEMTPALQAMLLRLLEDGTYTRIGESAPRKADFRLVCATCRDLPAMVARGDFRSDLFYRIHGASIGLPPLRDRSDRIALAEALLEDIARESEMPVPSLGDSARKRILAHDWPGNVRELKNALRHAVVLAQGALEEEHFPALVLRSTGETTREAPVVRSVREAEDLAVEAAIKAAAGNLSEAARTLGVSRSTLYRMMRRGESSSGKS